MSFSFSRFNFFLKKKIYINKTNNSYPQICVISGNKSLHKFFWSDVNKPFLVIKTTEQPRDKNVSPPKLIFLLYKSHTYRIRRSARRKQFSKFYGSMFAETRKGRYSDKFKSLRRPTFLLVTYSSVIASFLLTSS